MSQIRIGRVSSIDYQNGMMRILYSDRDNGVTKDMPYLSFNDEYKMPAVGQYVLVVHLSNGSEAGVILGSYWNEANRPINAKKGMYRKEFGIYPGQAFLSFDSEQEKMVLSANQIFLKGKDGEISLAEIIEKLG